MAEHTNEPGGKSAYYEEQQSAAICEELQLDECGWDPDVDRFLADRVAARGEDWKAIASDFWAELADGVDPGLHDRVPQVFGPEALASRWNWLQRGPTPSGLDFMESQPQAQNTTGSPPPGHNEHLQEDVPEWKGCWCCALCEWTNTFEASVIATAADELCGTLATKLRGPASAQLPLLLSNRALALLRAGSPRAALKGAGAAITLSALCQLEAWGKVMGKIWASYCKALNACGMPDLYARSMFVARTVAPAYPDTAAAIAALPQVSDCTPPSDRTSANRDSHFHNSDDLFASDWDMAMPSGVVQTHVETEEDWRLLGNEAFHKGLYIKAAWYYSAGLAACSGPVQEPLFKVARLHLKQGRFIDAHAIASALGILSEQSQCLELAHGCRCLCAQALLGMKRPGVAQFTLGPKHGCKAVLEQCSRQQEETRGNVDWCLHLSQMLGRIATGAAVVGQAANAHLDIADFVGPVSVALIPGKGRGLVASASLQRCQLVLCSGALASAHGVDARERLTMELSSALRRGGAGCSRILDLLHRRDLAAGPETRVPTVWDLLGLSEHCTPLPYLLSGADSHSETLSDSAMYSAVLDANSLGHVASGQPENASAGLWPLVAMCNHSDNPTATYSILGDILLLRTTIDLQEGEELCISYTAWDVSCRDRTDRLRDGWGIPPMSLEPSRVEEEDRLRVVPEWLRSYRAKHGLAAAKNAIIEVCQAITCAGPCRATAFRLQAVYCLRAGDTAGACHALERITEAAREAATLGEHVVESCGVQAVVTFSLHGQGEEASDTMRSALIATAEVYGTDCLVTGTFGEVTWQMLFWRLKMSLWLAMLGYSQERLAVVELEMRRWWTSPKLATKPPGI